MLRSIPGANDPNLLVGADHLDDAGVYKLDDSTALVVTLDFFPPLVDDPFTFGRIAAANALSDTYAMGGKPLTAMNIVGYPDDKLPMDLLGEILRGGAERVAAAGAVVAGGHSVRDAEIKYGLAVTGIVHPKRILTNAGAKPGDVLVLTKPLGTGVLTSAAKAGKITQDDLAEATTIMVELNADACAAAIDVGAHAVTDITGYGLIGHAHEIADASEVTLVIDTDAVPLLEGTLKWAAKGIITRAHKSNLAFLGNRFHGEGPDATLVNVLADAQTSGGLLIAIAQERADQLVQQLEERGVPSAAIVGRADPKSSHTVVVR